MTGFAQRTLDLILSLILAIFLLPLIFIVVIALLFQKGSILFIQKRVGKGQKIFNLYKFRTMLPSAPQVPTHEVGRQNITTMGKFLRKTKLDELPQLLNVLAGEMSLVGPRPCLPAQVDLIAERSKRGVFAVRPGITGLAQVRNVDMSEPIKLAKIEEEMIRLNSLGLYMRILLMTLIGRGQGDKVL